MRPAASFREFLQAELGIFLHPLDLLLKLLIAELQLFDIARELTNAALKLVDAHTRVGRVHLRQRHARPANHNEGRQHNSSSADLGADHNRSLGLQCVLSERPDTGESRAGTIVPLTAEIVTVTPRGYAKKMAAESHPPPLPLPH